MEALEHGPDDNGGGGGGGGDAMTLGDPLGKKKTIMLWVGCQLQVIS